MAKWGGFAARGLASTAARLRSRHGGVILSLLSSMVTSESLEQGPAHGRDCLEGAWADRGHNRMAMDQRGDACLGGAVAGHILGGPAQDPASLRGELH